MISKSVRRALYWLLLAVFLGAAIAIELPADFPHRVGYTLFRLLLASATMLLFWCVAFVKIDPPLVRIALTIIGLIMGFLLIENLGWSLE